MFSPMVFFFRNKKSKPFIGLTKSFAGAITVLAISGCNGAAIKSNSTEGAKKSNQKTDKNNKQALGFKTLGEPLTSIGENSSPEWSPDGLHILFVSKNRDTHKNSQIYEMDISDLKERRITYSDGDATDPQYVWDGLKVIYSSTTDELKERPLLLRKSEPADTLPPSDIYLSDTSGIEITRLTNRPGFDGDLQVNETRGNEFYFNSIRENQRQTFKFNLISKDSSLVFQNPSGSPAPIRRLFTSLSTRFAWVQVDANKTLVQQLMLATESPKNAKAVEHAQISFEDLHWFAGAKSGGEKLLITLTTSEHPLAQIVVYDPDKNCFSVILTGEKYQVSHGRLSPDQKRIIFVSNQIAGLQQIMIKSVEAQELECHSAGPK